MKKLLSFVRCAVDKYGMIRQGDRIAVGVSGGKDSVALLAAMAELRRFYPVKFEICAVTADPCFDGETDYSAVTELCRRIGVEHVIRRTELGRIIFEDRREKNPCSLCARMRRGMLHDMARECGCNRIALGHNMDDVAETFVMNLFYGGRISCFSPVSYLSRKDLYMIRPLIYLDEKEIIKAVKRIGLPVVKSKCPVDGGTKREETKLMLHELEKQYPGLRRKICGALHRDHISGF